MLEKKTCLMNQNNRSVLYEKELIRQVFFFRPLDFVTPHFERVQRSHRSGADTLHFRDARNMNMEFHAKIQKIKHESQRAKKNKKQECCLIESGTKFHAECKHENID